MFGKCRMKGGEPTVCVLIRLRCVVMNMKTKQGCKQGGQERCVCKEACRVFCK